METQKAKSIDDYIDGFPEEAQNVLHRIHAVIKKIVPRGEESISYGIPTIKLNGVMVIYFAGFKNHVSVYPAPRSHKDFIKTLAGYKGGKGTVQFPLDKPVPYSLVSRITRFRLKLSKERARLRAKKTGKKAKRSR